MQLGKPQLEAGASAAVGVCLNLLSSAGLQRDVLIGLGEAIVLALVQAAPPVVPVSPSPFVNAGLAGVATPPGIDGAQSGPPVGHLTAGSPFAVTKEESQEDVDLQKQHQETVANLTATLENQRATWMAAAAKLAALKEKPAEEAPPETIARAEQEAGAAQAVLTALETQVGELSKGYGKASAGA